MTEVTSLIYYWLEVDYSHWKERTTAQAAWDQTFSPSLQSYQDFYDEQEEDPTVRLRQGIDLEELSGAQGGGSEFEVDVDNPIGM